jgi:hypothetical protein
MALLIKAGQMTASDYVPTYPDLLLASEGASTDAVYSIWLGRLPLRREALPDALDADSILLPHSHYRHGGLQSLARISRRCSCAPGVNRRSKGKLAKGAAAGLRSLLPAMPITAHTPS